MTYEDELPEPETLDRGIADDNDPYLYVDDDSLPSWWKESLREFREHGLRPYQPPRFSDGTFVFQTIESLENEYDVDISFIGVSVTHGDEWQIYVDSEPVGDIGRHRDVSGYTVFEIESKEFKQWMQTLLE